MPLHSGDRVIREKRFKLYVGPDKQPVKLVDVLANPAENVNLIESRAPEAAAASSRMSAIIPAFPERDNDSIYEKNKERKESLYKVNNVTLIKIHTEHLPFLSKKLKRELIKAGYWNSWGRKINQYVLEDFGVASMAT